MMFDRLTAFVISFRKFYKTVFTEPGDAKKFWSAMFIVAVAVLMAVPEGITALEWAGIIAAFGGALGVYQATNGSA